jgi:acetolactate synthase I/II/III large subunit
MNGAESLLRTARDAGIDVCFANPGTTEMPIVVALDGWPARPVARRRFTNSRINRSSSST